MLGFHTSGRSRGAAWLRPHPKERLDELANRIVELARRRGGR